MTEKWTWEYKRCKSLKLLVKEKPLNYIMLFSCDYILANYPNAHVIIFEFASKTPLNPLSMQASCNSDTTHILCISCDQVCTVCPSGNIP